MSLSVNTLQWWSSVKNNTLRKKRSLSRCMYVFKKLRINTIDYCRLKVNNIYNI